MSDHRGSFASKIGIVLATAGSAVGLGNIWRFPYEAGQNGGGAFLLIYILCIAMLGLPCMLSEFILGRHAGANATRAYGGMPWKLTGYLGVFTGFIIMGFYSVVAGWTLQYTYASLRGHLVGNPDYVSQYFESFIQNPWKPVAWTIVFLLLTHVVIARGVERGIERASKIFMPLLFILLIILVVCSLLLPGSGSGVEFFFKPDFSKVSGSTFLNALGQAFFSLSTGMACLCTYASYFSRDVHLFRSASQIAFIDTLIAILSGLLIFPAAFSVGLHPDSGPSLVFITLPNVFQQAFSSVPLVGYIVSILFYLLLVLAALTSIISMHETPTSFVIEETHLSRNKASSIVTFCAIVVGALCSLSLGPVPSISIGGRPLFDFFDNLSANILLPLGGLLTCLYVGWVLPRRTIAEELGVHSTTRHPLYSVFLFVVRYVCPVSIFLILLHQFRVV